ncbi:EboA domain-containing protein [Actinomadura macrotermitis]|uniref:Sugar phosphate isomerase n=1 Tax=Actinomadura macrotermitis TaxID=2585200 RepID=A0A7K0BXR5_9ACTN|nr:EboA domain-containing protein [Actinomadura macrotermitis]MQY05973.1 hypothetical protein [Actinomadura macrotermitis]
MEPDDLVMDAKGWAWLAYATAHCAADPAAIGALFPTAGRACGREPVSGRPEWSVDQEVRVRLMLALPLTGAGLGAAVFDLYRYGDAAERVAVLRGLARLDAERALGDAGLPIVHDALRTNDARLITAAVGPYAAAHLDDDAYRQAVLKCAFTGVPLTRVAGLARRADRELIRMLTDYTHERRVAGRDIAPDIVHVVEQNGHL